MTFEEKYSDKHFKYSIAKSVIRLLACFSFVVLLTLIILDVEMTLETFAIVAMIFPVGMAIAEILGIMEENI